jgi:hypothetical protein
MNITQPVALVALLLASLSTLPVAGQGKSAPQGGWTPPKTADGIPDIQGHWVFSYYPDGTFRPGNPAASIEAYAPTPFRAGGPSLIVDLANGRIPYRPEVLAMKRKLTDLADHAPLASIDPNAYCSLQGVPRTNYMGNIQVLQTSGAVTVLTEFTHMYRFILTNGQPHVSGVSTWQGDSRGHWEGNTLVVDVTNLNGKAWMDSVGNFTSDDFHVTERWTPLDAKTLLYEATIEAPKIYSQPWKTSFRLTRNSDADYELMEMACHEGERSFEHIIEANPALLQSVK